MKNYQEQQFAHFIKALSILLNHTQEAIEQGNCKQQTAWNILHLIENIENNLTTARKEIETALAKNQKQES